MAKSRTPSKISQTTGRRRKKKFKFNIFIPFLIVGIILALFLIFIFFIFPIQLNKRIKEDLITIFSPSRYNDGNNIFVMKIEEELNNTKELNNFFLNKYGISFNVEKVKSGSDRNIYKIIFTKRKYNIAEIKDVYIYYDEPHKENIKYEEKTKEKNLVKEIVVNRKESIKKDKKIVKKNVEVKKENFKNEKKIFDNSASQEKRYDKKKYKLSIVIDDLGYNNKNIYEYIKLNIPVTFALIPELPNSKKIYDLLISNNCNTILHIPMEPQKGEVFVEKNGLFASLSDEELKDRIDRFISLYPSIRGANNHMGSKAVTDDRIMNILFSSLSKQNFFWLDSYTNPASISEDMAKKYGIKHYRRDVFLDNEKNYLDIKKSFLNLVKESQKKDLAIGIGHIQTDELVTVLKEFYFNRTFYNIEFVKLK